MAVLIDLVCLVPNCLYKLGRTNIMWTRLRQQIDDSRLPEGLGMAGDTLATFGSSFIYAVAFSISV